MNQNLIFRPPDAPSQSCVFTAGVTMARDLGRRLGLRGVLVEESESWESWRVTQLMTFARWFTLQLPHKCTLQKHHRLAYPQTVDTLEGIFAFLGLPLALAPALPARGISRVGRSVRPLRVGSTVHTDRIILGNTHTRWGITRRTGENSGSGKERWRHIGKTCK